jgi:sirohydrochlorin ferrochelatase
MRSEDQPQPEKRKAILLIAHGSREEPANREVVEMGERLALRLPGFKVVPCFLDVVEPGIAQGFRTAVESGAREIVVIPCFLTTGAHVALDIPRILSDCLRESPGVAVAITPAIGPDPALDDIVLTRIRGAEANG